MNSAPSSAPPQAPPDELPNQDLVFYINMALFGVLGVATLVYLPRTIARYANKSSRRQGWVLLQGRVDYSYSKSEIVNPPSTSYPPYPVISGDAPRSPLSNLDTNSPSTFKEPILVPGDRSSSGPPPKHVRGYLSYIPAIARVLEYHILGYTVQQLAILSGYLALICIALFYKSDPATNVPRAGFVVLSQMPIVFGLGTKNSVVTALTGISYEKLNFLHRWVGRLMFIAALFHLVGWLVLFNKMGIISIGLKGNRWGIVAFVALCFCALGSNPWFRLKFYTIFWHSHILGFFALMIAVWKHQPDVAIPYIVACIALYGGDQLVRLAKTRVRKAILTPIPELGCKHVQIPRIDHGWAAGQHVRLRVLSFGVGIFGWTECHPFTIANAGNDAPEGMTLVCKSIGNWTTSLYRMASEKSSDNQPRNVYVLVEGPYGGPGNILFTSFSGAMIVLGGSGITFGTSILEDIIAKSLNKSARVICVKFVWVVPHPSAVDPYLSSFLKLVKSAETVPNLNLTISVFYTRGADDARVLQAELPPSIQLRDGRPNLRQELDEAIRTTRTSIDTVGSSRNGFIIAGCGPKGLISSLSTVKAETPGQTQAAVGGLELYTESFGW